MLDDIVNGNATATPGLNATLIVERFNLIENALSMIENINCTLH